MASVRAALADPSLRQEAARRYAARALAPEQGGSGGLTRQLEEFSEVKASVLQLTRSPGKGIVYLGCLLLVAGVFAMFYIRERRMWVWVRDTDEGAHALMAMSTQRKTLDFEREFDDLKVKLPQPA